MGDRVRVAEDVVPGIEVSIEKTFEDLENLLFRAAILAKGIPETARGLFDVFPEFG